MNELLIGEHDEEGDRIGEAQNPGPQSGQGESQLTWNAQIDQEDEEMRLSHAWEEPPDEDQIGMIEAEYWQSSHNVSTDARTPGDHAQTAHNHHTLKPVAISIAAALNIQGEEMADDDYIMAKAIGAWRASWSAWADIMAGCANMQLQSTEEAGLRDVESIAMNDARRLARVQATWSKSKKLKDNADKDKPDKARDSDGDHRDRETHPEVKSTLEKLGAQVREGFLNNDFLNAEWLDAVKISAQNAITGLEEARATNAGRGEVAYDARIARRG